MIKNISLIKILFLVTPIPFITHNVIKIINIFKINSKTNEDFREKEEHSGIQEPINME
jgi:hypothetical protein